MRRLTPVAGFLARLRAQKPEPQPVHRCVEARENASAGVVTQFSSHWVIAVREHFHRYRQTVLHATPGAALNGASPKFAAAFGLLGLALPALRLLKRASSCAMCASAQTLPLAGLNMGTLHSGVPGNSRLHRAQSTLH